MKKFNKNLFPLICINICLINLINVPLKMADSDLLPEVLFYRLFHFCSCQ